jgi:hypothetical protein
MNRWSIPHWLEREIIERDRSCVYCGVVAKLSEEERRDYSIRKEILWESETASEAELSAMEVELIRKYGSNDPRIGYNRWPKFYPPSDVGPRSGGPGGRGKGRPAA